MSGRTVFDAGRRSRAPMFAAALAGLLILLLSALASLLAWQSFTASLSAAETRARDASQVVAAHMQWLMEAARQALLRIDTEMATSRPDLEQDGNTDLDEAVSGLPDRIFAWVFDATGRSVQSNVDGAGAVDISQEPYFKTLKTGAEWAITPLRQGFVTDQPIFVIGHRIERQGVFLGVASLTVPVDVLAEFWRSLDLGPSSTVGVVRADGWLVARYPVPEESIDLSASPLFSRHLKDAPIGAYSSERSPLDGVPRIVGYYTIPGLGLVATAGVSKTALYAQFQRRILVGGIVTVPLILLLAAASVWIYRLLQRDDRKSEALGIALEENRMLFREIHHRVKNNLQTVASLINLQPGAPEEKQAMIRRIGAMTAVHEQIYGGDQFARVDLRDYLTSLLCNLRESYGSAARLDLAIEPLEADTEIALPFGLVVNEVVSNAFKHAFPEGRAGTIAVRLSGEQGGKARLTIRDDGVGVEEARKRPRAEQAGMGSRLIDGLTRQIGGTGSLSSQGGTLYELVFPLARQPPAEA